MSILDTVFRRREPAVKYRTIDGGHPAPYPDMTDEQLYNYEMTFNVPKKTFDKPPGDIANSRAHVTEFGRTGAHSREHGIPEDPPVTAFRSTGQRTTGARNTNRSEYGASRQNTGHASAPHTDAEQDVTHPSVTQRIVSAQAEPPLDFSKPVRTSTTKQVVEIITTRARHPLFKVLGYIGDDQVVTMFTLNGQISENGACFLENVPQKQSLYLNIYPNRSMGGRERFFLTQHESREAADAAATVERIDCVQVEFDLKT